MHYLDPRASHHGDLVIDDVTAVRQDGEDGGRVQQPVNHMDNPVGRHDVGGHQSDALLPQQDLTLQEKAGGSASANGNCEMFPVN